MQERVRCLTQVVPNGRLQFEEASILNVRTHHAIIMLNKRSVLFISTQSVFCSGLNREAKSFFSIHKTRLTARNGTLFALYKVYRTYHRLIGAPTLSPPLHVRVHAVYDISDEDEIKCSTHAYSYDIIPRDAKSGKTLYRLLLGQCVPAEIRARRVTWPLRDKAVFCIYCGTGVAEQAMIQHYLDCYTGCSCQSEKASQLVGLALRTHNCWNFADRLINVMLAK